MPLFNLSAAVDFTMSAVNRITNLPLLNSAFNLVSSAYSSTKEMHPCLSGVCNVAETVAAVAVGSVVGGAQPILNQLDSQSKQRRQEDTLPIQKG
uniref:Uncharacterized protein n=1 Tax=Pavo cristatus TaxID=9049 RepID=A0A8C9F4A8_PAVCR